MDKLGEIIYNQIMENEESALQMQNRINSETEKLILPYKNKITEEEYEKLRYLMYDISEVSQKQSILFGIKLFIKFIFYLL